MQPTEQKQPGTRTAYAERTARLIVGVAERIEAGALITIPEAAAYFHCGPTYVRNLIKEGRIKAIRVSPRRTRIDGASIRKLKRSTQILTAEPVRRR